LGLFIHNRWSDAFRSKISFLESQPRLKRWVVVTSTILTFHYVSLGWVWFVLPAPDQSLKTFMKLFGIT
jgi:D-alanyl-lipoteichoic acid acyltransferase DltB (MBOAT superfamily)